MSVRACVCACVYEHLCVCVCERFCVCACVFACVLGLFLCVCAHECRGVCACVCACKRPHPGRVLPQEAAFVLDAVRVTDPLQELHLLYDVLPFLLRTPHVTGSTPPALHHTLLSAH